MKEIERQGPLLSPLGHILYRQMREIEIAIEDKYQSVRPVEEAKMDALVFASSQLGFLKLEAFMYKSRGEDPEISEQSASQWEEAVNSAMHDNWVKMKNALQKDARTALTASRFELADNSIMGDRLANGEQKLADSYINLIKSLGV